MKTEVQVNPLTDNCSIPFSAQEHVCFGISPFNSLFSEHYISSLISWGMNNFKSFHLFIPDQPTIYTLEALGYNEAECKKKLKKQVNWLKNKVNKALETNGVGVKADHILDWQTLADNQNFKDELDKVFGLFDSDESFRSQCMLASRWVLQNKIDDKELTDKILLKAVKYLLCEIPLFAATNKVIGTKTSLFCYHQSVDFHIKLYHHKLNLIPEMGQGFGIIST